MQSHSSSKKPKTLLLPKGKNLLGAPCLCTPAEISPPWRRLGCRMGSTAVALCSAVVAHVGTHGGKPVGCLQCQPGSAWTPGEMRSSKLSVGGCTLVPQPETAGSVLQPVFLPFPAALASSHGVFAMLDGAHHADRQGDIILSGSVPKQESEGADVASCSQLRWLLCLPSCCLWLAGFADACPSHRPMQELPSALSSVWLL